MKASFYFSRLKGRWKNLRQVTNGGVLNSRQIVQLTQNPEQTLAVIAAVRTGHDSRRRLGNGTQALLH